MKKISKLMLVVLVLVTVFALSACSETATNTIEGKFSISAATQGETEFDAPLLRMALGENYEEENYIQFNSDGTFEINAMGINADGKYTYSGETVTLSSNGALDSELKATLINNDFVIDVDDTKMTFVRK